MNISIRQEKPQDEPVVFKVIEQAFKNAEFTDHHEQFLVGRLRNSEAFIPELSLVAEYENKVVDAIGHKTISPYCNLSRNTALLQVCLLQCFSSS